MLDARDHVSIRSAVNRAGFHGIMRLGHIFDKHNFSPRRVSQRDSLYSGDAYQTS